MGIGDVAFSLATGCGPWGFPLGPSIDREPARELAPPLEESAITRFCLGGVVIGYSRFSRTFLDTVGEDRPKYRFAHPALR
jgi:hypothetical protein